MLTRKTVIENDGKLLGPVTENPRFADAALALSELNSEVAALQATVQKLQGAAWLRSQVNEGLSGREALEQAQRLLAGEATELSDASTKIREAQQRWHTARWPRSSRRQHPEECSCSQPSARHTRSCMLWALCRSAG